MPTKALKRIIFDEPFSNVSSLSSITKFPEYYFPTSKELNKRLIHPNKMDVEMVNDEWCLGVALTTLPHI